jgi:Domain of unknown function (DUF5666)
MSIKSSVTFVFWAASSVLLLADDKPSLVVKKNVIHTWESVGEVVQVTDKTFSIRQTLKLSEATWSLLPGAISEVKQLKSGDQIHVKGATLPDGTYDTRRIFLIGESNPQPQTASGVTPVQGSDYGGPEGKAPPQVAYGGDPGLEGRGAGGPGRDSRVPPPGRPGGGSTGTPEGLQSSRIVSKPRFLPGDVEGVVEQVSPERVLLAQTLYFDKQSTVVGRDGEALKGKDLKAGQRVAITIRDEVDPKTNSRKAVVIRLLP